MKTKFSSALILRGGTLIPALSFAQSGVP